MYVRCNRFVATGSILVDLFVFQAMLLGVEDDPLARRELSSDLKDAREKGKVSPQLAQAIAEYLDGRSRISRLLSVVTDPERDWLFDDFVVAELPSSEVALFASWVRDSYDGFSVERLF